MSTENFEEIESLLVNWEEGTLDDDGIERLRSILRTDEDARKRFVEMQTLHAALTLERDAGFGLPALDEAARKIDSPPPTTAKSPATRQMRSLGSSAVHRVLVAAAALLLCAIVGRWIFLESTDRQSPNEIANIERAGQRGSEKEATSQGIAIVTRLVDVVWQSDQTPLEIGDALSPGTLAVKSGYAQIEFFCGATVIIEGPAELDLKSATLARVDSGRLRAQVPPAARGFSLEINDMQVVDLGTEFGLSVSPKSADVQVFDGEVELHQPSEEKRRLTAGQAVVRNGKGAYEESDVTPESFVDIATLESRAQSQQTARYQRWKAWSDKLRRDPRLIAYYAFDQKGGWQRRLESSIEPTNSELDGAIVGAHRVDGRWGSKWALEFKRPGDRVRVQIPGEYGSLTFACWVKIDSLDRWYNSLFLTDYYNKGEPHWQILDTGQLFFSVRPRSDVDMRGRDPKRPEHRKVLSPPFWEPSMSGKWLHLATTYNVDGARTTHYLNGQVLHSEQIPELQLVKTTRIGAASIGNWSLPTKPDAHFAIRNLNGCIDEFALFAAALTEQEIKEIYENGKP